METTLYNQTGKKVGAVALSEKVFGLKWNADLVHQVAVSMMANARAQTAHTKNRGDVSGGGIKPWKQKGTGRARHGSSRSPIWVGGGITFGPRNDKDYSKKINKKMRAKALLVALSKRAASGRLLALDAITLSTPKTKDAHTLLASLATIKGFEKLISKKKTTALVIAPSLDEAVVKSFANLPGVTLATAQEINVLDVLRNNHIVIVTPTEVESILAAKMA